MSLDDVTLNTDQNRAAKLIKNFIQDKSTAGHVFTLTGGPGTGKTFMLREVLKQYVGGVQGATVSHAAKNVLQESLGTRVECVTLAKLLGLNQSISDEGEVKFVQDKSGRQQSQIGKGAKLLIIDEVSQIPDSIFEIIMHEIGVHGVKLIAVGDPYQLPPVEQEHDSRFFDRIHSRLTIPMRFQGPIASLVGTYRTQIDSINSGIAFNKWALNSFTHRENDVQNNTGYLFTNKLDEVIELAADNIKSNPSDLSYARVLAFKNESVAEINRRIRRAIYGDNLNQFETNELVICNGGYAITDHNGREPILYNGQILKVSSFKSAIGPYEIPCVLMAFDNFSNPNGRPIYVVDNDPESKLIYNKIAAGMIKEAKSYSGNIKLSREAWKRYYMFIESFAYLDFSSSLSVYKSQGQTLTNVYVCEGEIMGVKPLSWKQKFQALYVAMTRAKEKLYIYNKEF